MCGEAATGSSQYESIQGLSPRVRGSLISLTFPSSALGSIPACAGKPSAPCRGLRAPRVYPRVCGEADDRELKRQMQEGLSPRVRGSPGEKLVSLGVGGSIPACAGKPNLDGTDVMSLGVYPRVCGEAVVEERQRHAVRGLSPRVRGSRVIVRSYRDEPGSIPACAGKPSASGRR